MPQFKKNEGLRMHDKSWHAERRDTASSFKKNSRRMSTPYRVEILGNMDVAESVYIRANLTLQIGLYLSLEIWSTTQIFTVRMDEFPKSFSSACIII